MVLGRKREDAEYFGNLPEQRSRVRVFDGFPEQFRAEVSLAERLGAPELLLWESNYIGLPPANAEAVKAMGDYARDP